MSRHRCLRPWEHLYAWQTDLGLGGVPVRRQSDGARSNRPTAQCVLDKQILLHSILLLCPTSRMHIPCVPVCVSGLFPLPLHDRLSVKASLTNEPRLIIRM